MTSYSSKDIRTLKPMDQIRLNPGMWIGPTDDPHHLIEECLDNALDEAQGGHVKIIAVMIDTKNNIYSVIDDGRGIPISDKTPIKISTELFSGAKFQDEKTAYEIASGLHGVGLVAVNALSETYKIEIYKDSRHAVYNFKNGKLKHSKIDEFEGEKPFSSKIEFSPSEKIFSSVIPNLTRIKRRLMTASAEMNNGVTFILNVDGNKEIIKLDLVSHFKQTCSLSEESNGIVYLKSFNKPEKFYAMFAYDTKGSVAPKAFSSVNLLPVDGGGTHINMFYEIVRDLFNAKAKKLGYNFQPQDCLIGLRVYLMLSLIEPKFGGQTKDKLINQKATLVVFINQLKLALTNYFNENQEYLEDLLTLFQDYRRSLDSKKMKSNNGGKRVSTKFSKLKDCTSKNGEIFIVEGDSAGGGFVQCRNSRMHAIFPLRGKIPSAANWSIDRLLKHKEVGELIRALGTGYGPDFNIADLKYGKIIITADADFDGLHICCLAIMVFAKVVPEIIKAGKLYYVDTPLWCINESKHFIPLWTDQEVEDARNNNRILTRYKGLGEFNADQLKVVTLDPQTRKLVQIQYSNNMDKINRLFSVPEEKRKMISEENYSI